jgi:hypothetical protein
MCSLLLCMQASLQQYAKALKDARKVCSRQQYRCITAASAATADQMHHSRLCCHCWLRIINVEVSRCLSCNEMPGCTSWKPDQQAARSGG